MFDIGLFVLKWIIGPIVGVAVTLLFKEPLKERLAPLVARLGSKKEQGVQGRWLATFTYGSPPKEIAEVIEISSLFGMLVGRIIPNPANSGDPKIAKDKPIRVRGTLKDNFFFTGVWLHPNKRSHQMGAFQLIIAKDNERMQGQWLGYSETKHEIEWGSWNWKRVEA